MGCGQTSELGGAEAILALAPHYHSLSWLERLAKGLNQHQSGPTGVYPFSVLLKDAEMKKTEFIFVSAFVPELEEAPLNSFRFQVLTWDREVVRWCNMTRAELTTYFRALATIGRGIHRGRNRINVPVVFEDISHTQVFLFDFAGVQFVNPIYMDLAPRNVESLSVCKGKEGIACVRFAAEAIGPECKAVNFQSVPVLQLASVWVQTTLMHVKAQGLLESAKQRFAQNKAMAEQVANALGQG